LKKTNDGEYEVRAFAPDGAEHVKFQIVCYESNEEPRRYIIEASRLSGCPYFFHALLEKAIVNDDKECINTLRLFRPPPIPQNLTPKDEESGNVSDLNLVLSKAINNSDNQQWREGCCALLSLCSHNKKLYKRFKQCDAWDLTIKTMQSEANDPIIKHVGERLVQLE